MIKAIRRWFLQLSNPDYCFVHTRRKAMVMYNSWLCRQCELDEVEKRSTDKTARLDKLKQQAEQLWGTK